jgi:hypothetical protein
MILLRDAPLALSFLVGMFLLLGEPRFVRSARASGGLALSRNGKRFLDQLVEPLLRDLAIPELASRI